LNKIVLTSDGSHTIFVPGLNEHYHSINGAVQESEFIFIRNGFESFDANPVNIFEVGFGTGLNALLTAIKSSEGDRDVSYTTIEKYPLSEEIVNSLNYNHFIQDKYSDIFSLIHSAPWNTGVKICRNFTLTKIEGDLTSIHLPSMYNLIYFDAFGPDKQPEMWTPEVFNTIGTGTVKDGVFVTYSAKGEVKRNLRASAFDVKLLPGPPGKRQIIRAVKI
jgi:tRNA U34 5-methylaminomethyl-2-thiouridine-forming methyltransferase MnmC